jgi:ribosomal-protein-alanine N-acetyltransferase
MMKDKIVPFDYKRDYIHFIRIEIQRFDQPMTRTLTDFLLKKHGNNFWWVIDHNGDEIIDAYIIAGIDRGNNLHIFSIAVREAYEGKGLAGRLLDHLIIQAKGLKLDCVCLEVRENNTRAIKLYESRGFVKKGITKNYYDEGLHAIQMEKTLLVTDKDANQ